jgi:hypothetical protein
MTGNTNRTRWAGLIPTALVTLMLTASAAGKLAAAPAMVDGLIRAGIPPAAITPIAILELSCLALYLIPRTAVLGTLLLTGYFGGATLTHLIAGEALLPPLVIGLIIWAGAWFRVPALRALIPLRRMEVRNNAYRTPGHEPVAAEF